MGNTNQGTHIKDVFHSVPYSPRQGQNALYVHQEIDANHYGYIKPPTDTARIFSMVNCFPYSSIWKQYKEHLSDIDMKFYGAGCPDGALSGSKGVGEKMKLANLGWHMKPLGGLGHTAMGWFASGRSVITNMSQNVRWGGDAIRLFEPGITCLDIEAHSPEENCKLIRQMIDNSELWAEKAYKRFHDIIDYNEEEAQVRRFLGRIL